MITPWIPLIALAATLLPLVWVKRLITRMLHELSMRWVGDADVALTLYFVVVLPGVVVHELSHWLMAKLLGIRVSRPAIGPVRRGRSKRVTLGSVRIGKADWLRASLIGLAPLLGGTAIILLIGLLVLDVGNLAEIAMAQGLEGIAATLEQAMQVPDFWLWLYLVFSVSNSMQLSEADMSSVRPVLLFLGFSAAILLIVGGVPNIPEEVVRGVNSIAGYLATAFGLSLAIDGLVVLVLWVLLTVMRRLQPDRVYR
jgi:hypothetical protein